MYRYWRRSWCKLRSTTAIENTRTFVISHLAHKTTVIFAFNKIEIHCKHVWYQHQHPLPLEWPTNQCTNECNVVKYYTKHHTSFRTSKLFKLYISYRDLMHAQHKSKRRACVIKLVVDSYDWATLWCMQCNGRWWIQITNLSHTTTSIYVISQPANPLQTRIYSRRARHIGKL